jgi:hypothetical protein
MKDSVGEECGNNVGGDVGSPEPGETSGQFPVLVEIAQVENDLFFVNMPNLACTFLNIERSYIRDESSVDDGG